MFYPNYATDSLPLKKLSWKPLKTLYLDAKEELTKISLKRQTLVYGTKYLRKAQVKNLWKTAFKKFDCFKQTISLQLCLSYVILDRVYLDKQWLNF